MADTARITIRVHPGAARPRLGAEPGGSLATGPGVGHGPGDGRGPLLGVWVRQRAIDGKATEAALAALAGALAVRRADLRLVVGARARVKIVEIADPPADLADRLASLAAG
ncbi:MAG: DUF167 domain-containing protein [Streptosporangiaceae bacterium]